MIIVIGAGVSFFISTKQAPTAQQTTPNPTSTSAPTNTQLPNKQTPTSSQVDKTANWQTYRNEEYGFEVKYPNSFIADKPLKCFQMASDVVGSIEPPPEIYEAGASIKFNFRERIPPPYIRDNGFQPLFDGILAPKTEYCLGYLLSIWIEEKPSNFEDLKLYLQGLIKRRISNSQVFADQIFLHEYNFDNLNGFLVSTNIAMRFSF